MPSNINEIYILHLVGYNSVTNSMGSISIRLAVVAFQMYEIAQNSSKVRTYSSHILLTYLPWVH